MKFHFFDIAVGDTLYSAQTDSNVTVKGVDEAYNFILVTDDRGRETKVKPDGTIKGGTNKTGVLYFWSKPPVVYPVPEFKHNNRLRTVLTEMYAIFVTHT